MLKTSNILFKVAAAALVVLLAAGCIFEKEDPTVKSGVKNVLVQIGVNTSGMVQTKAQTAGTEDPVKTIETTVNTLRVYAYIGGVLSGYLYTTNVDTENHALLMDIKLPAAGNAVVDFVAVANEGGMTVPQNVNLDYAVGREADGSLKLTGNAGQDELNMITYTVADQTFSKGMPMYAVGKATINVDNVGEMNEDEGHEGHFILKEKINITLTRSLAKVLVYAAEEGTSDKNNVKINSVKISNVLSSGYLFPTTTYPTTYAAEATISNTQVTVDKKLNRDDANFATKRTSAENYTLVTSTPYYISENNKGATAWDQAVEGATKLTINYTTGSGAAKDAVIYMPKVERNNIYKVLCLVKANGELELNLNVVDWQVATATNINFTNEATFNRTYGLKWNGSALSGDTYSLGVAAGREVTCSFELTSPVGGRWYASLSDGDVQNYEIVGGSGDIGEGVSSFIIKTRKSNLNSGDDKKVKLTITAVNTAGRSMVVKFNNAGYYYINQNQM